MALICANCTGFVAQVRNVSKCLNSVFKIQGPIEHLKQMRSLKLLEKFLSCKLQSLKTAFWHCYCFGRLMFYAKTFVAVNPDNLHLLAVYTVTEFISFLF